MMQDTALVAALQAGEPRAFDTLLRDYGPRLLRLARHLLGNEEDARDVLQDAMVSVHRSIDRFASGSALSTWLHRIVVNAALMKLRTKRRHPEEDIEPLLPRFREDGHQVEPSAPWNEAADALLEREELRAAVREAIARLPDA
ncbi:MAG TPA: sigma-70 family RNA polymerase sigma factor, partial [Thermoanaerobaculia bacterium]|nr:sigma-70 family RNA polymerase sigma factor [Thermoanaerobaculia bacterium]